MAVNMKLMKKQLSTSHAVTVALLRDIDGVANHGNSRLDRCPMASPSKAKVESITQVSFARLSGKGMKFIPGIASPRA